MLSFSAFKKSDDNVTEPANAPASKTAKPAAAHPLDELTGGAFSAPTSGERAAKLREWLASGPIAPSAEQMQEVFKEMSARDKGAAKPLKEKLDELKRSASQEHIAAEWAGKAQALMDSTKFNIADALAWQRDAAKAGAPLSKEPLSGLRSQLNERIKQIEDLQHRAQVQREAAMLLAQRIELLSTKPLVDAQAAQETLTVDVANWRAQTSGLMSDGQWPSTDPKFTPQLETAQSQLSTLWEAFSAALGQAVAALSDAAAPLPAVPVWADAIRNARALERGETVEKKADKPVKPRIDPEKRQAAVAVVREKMAVLEKELAEGHGKASVQAANDVRAALKAHGDYLDEKTENAARDALGAAGEMEGWQRWRANQLREELIAKAQALVAKPLGGRKQQEAVRALREAWKQTDQGGMPNHGMWRKFDEACNEAHKIVEAWLDKVKAEEVKHKADRLAIIEEIQNWTAANAARTDWKQVDRELHAFSEKWRAAGHVGEKTFAELQPQYKAAIKAAHGPLETAQKASLERRRALIEEASQLGAQTQLRIDAVKALQARWQSEAQSVPMDRKEEQKLWDAFRKPIDEAFNRKSQAREAQAAAMSAHDKAVLDATQALDAAIAAGDAKAIRAAMDALDAASRGRAPAPTSTPTPTQVSVPAAPVSEENKPLAGIESAQSAIENIANDAATIVQEAGAESVAQGADQTIDPIIDPTINSAADQSAEQPADPSGAESMPEIKAEAAKPAAPAKPVVARRGDDRPGAKLQTAAKPDAGRGAGKFGDKKFGDRKPGERRDGRDGRDSRDGRDGRGPDRRSDPRHEAGRDDRGPRLSNTAFYAMRDGMDRAQQALKKLAMQAHGESLVNLLSAWESRNAEQMPSTQQLGKALTPAARASWSQALGKPASGDSAQALLRLEMAAEVPTPAEQLDARRAMQLQLLTQRGQATPKDTWVQDAAAVLASAHEEKSARRLQNALKALLR